MSWKINEKLKSLGTLLGAVVVLAGFFDYKKTKSNKTSLYISLAITVVGPVEDLLKKIINDKYMPDDQREIYIELVDQLTSITFLALLGLVLKELSGKDGQ